MAFQSKFIKLTFEALNNLATTYFSSFSFYSPLHSLPFTQEGLAELLLLFDLCRAVSCICHMLQFCFLLTDNLDTCGRMLV